MEVVVVKQVPSLDFNFEGSACSTPFISAPSSPKRLVDFYYSAPTSPTHISAIYREFNTNGNGGSSSSSSSMIPFDWEETPGTPKSRDAQDDDDGDFAFDFSGQLEKPSLSAADELFDHGKIRPLKPPPRLQISCSFDCDDSSAQKSLASSPRSPRSPIEQGRKMFRETFSPRQRKDVDPFAAAIEQTRKDPERGREKAQTPVVPRHRVSRSLSPFRIFEFPWKEEPNEDQKQQNSKPTSANAKESKPMFSGYRKWRLKDFLLFRSASEGRATDKDPLRKFAAFSSRSNEDSMKTSSFRSTDSFNSSVSSSKRRAAPVSPHELHYTLNRAVSEEMKKKTFLPYKRGLLGCLGFNPTVQGMTKGFNL